MVSPTLSATFVGYQAGPASFTQIESETLRMMRGFAPSHSQLNDTLTSAVKLDPTPLAAATPAKEITEGLRGIGQGVAPKTAVSISGAGNEVIYGASLTKTFAG